MSWPSSSFSFSLSGAAREPLRCGAGRTDRYPNCRLAGLRAGMRCEPAITTTRCHPQEGNFVSKVRAGKDALPGEPHSSDSRLRTITFRRWISGHPIARSLVSTINTRTLQPRGSAMIQKDWIPETLALESLAVTVGGTILLGERERENSRS